jgi:hypothetical protein
LLICQGKKTGASDVGNHWWVAVLGEIIGRDTGRSATTRHRIAARETAGFLTAAFLAFYFAEANKDSPNGTFAYALGFCLLTWSPTC